MEGPTSSSGSRNRLTCLTLQKHDDDDDDDFIPHTNVQLDKPLLTVRVH